MTLDVYNRMSQALHGNENIPAEGHTKLYPKALWLCGEKPWKWYNKDEIDPNDPLNRPLFLSRPDMFTMAVGVWIYKKRYITNGDPRSVGTCGQYTLANTMVLYDMITFCDISFIPPVAGAESPVDGKIGVVAGNKRLDDFGQYSLSRIMVHELAHWYGVSHDTAIIRRKILIRINHLYSFGPLTTGL